jgi:hypothetical protein
MDEKYLLCQIQIAFKFWSLWAKTQTKALESVTIARVCDCCPNKRLLGESRDLSWKSDGFGLVSNLLRRKLVGEKVKNTSESSRETFQLSHHKKSPSLAVFSIWFKWPVCSKTMQGRNKNEAVAMSWGESCSDTPRKGVTCTDRTHPGPGALGLDSDRNAEGTSPCSDPVFCKEIFEWQLHPMFVYLVGCLFFGILELSMKYPKLGQLGPSLAKTEDKMTSRGETILHSTPNLEIKQGLDGQTRAQRRWLCQDLCSVLHLISS